MKKFICLSLLFSMACNETQPSQLSEIYTPSEPVMLEICNQQDENLYLAIGDFKDGSTYFSKGWLKVPKSTCVDATRNFYTFKNGNPSQTDDWGVSQNSNATYVRTDRGHYVPSQYENYEDFWQATYVTTCVPSIYEQSPNTTDWLYQWEYDHSLEMWDQSCPGYTQMRAAINMRFLWHDDLAGGGTKYRYTFESDDGKSEPPIVADLFEYGIQSKDAIGGEILSTYNGLKQFKAGFDNMAENLKMAVVLAEGALRQADMLRAIDANREKREQLVQLAKGLTQVALGITPVGDSVDFYEMWYGKDIYGKELSREERVYAGIGLIGGNRYVWEATVAAAATVTTPLIKKYLRNGAETSDGWQYFYDLRDVVDQLRPRFPDIPAKDIKNLPGGSKEFTKKVRMGQRDVTVTVRYGVYGFPDFSPFLKKVSGAQKNVVRIKLSGKRSTDESLANKLAGFEETPDGYTWHHHQKLGRMELVDIRVHKAFAHNGGVSIYQKVFDVTYN